MSLFGEIHPLFPKKQGIGALTGLILEVLIFPVCDVRVQGELGRVLRITLKRRGSCE
jgi:hypothetical protein